MNGSLQRNPIIFKRAVVLNLLLNLKSVARRATILCLLSFLGSGQSIAAILQVGPSPEASFNSIQAAIDASFTGDTILVSPGIYAENIAIGKSLIIESTDGAGATTIQSPAPSSASARPKSLSTTGSAGAGACSTIREASAGVVAFRSSLSMLSSSAVTGVGAGSRSGFDTVVPRSLAAGATG